MPYIVEDDGEMRLEPFKNQKMAEKGAKALWRVENPALGYAELWFTSRRDGQRILVADDGMTTWATGIAVRRADG